jgi:hypothetical protein
MKNSFLLVAGIVALSFATVADSQTPQNAGPGPAVDPGNAPGSVGAAAPGVVPAVSTVTIPCQGMQTYNISTGTGMAPWHVLTSPYGAATAATISGSQPTNWLTSPPALWVQRLAGPNAVPHNPGNAYAYTIQINVLPCKGPRRLMVEGIVTADDSYVARFLSPAPIATNPPFGPVVASGNNPSASKVILHTVTVPAAGGVYRLQILVTNNISATGVKQSETGAFFRGIVQI